MNERIRQLAEQAGFIDFIVFNRIESKEQVIEKFAQLIVQECISIVEEQKECLHEEQQYWHDRDYGYALAVDDASKGIKQFFGVEE
jgi:hypothetical protein